VSDVIRLCPDGFIVLSGDDFTAVPTVFVGGKGVISVVSNVCPRATADMMEAALAGDIAKANALHYRLYPMMKALFAAPSPVPSKKAMELLGVIANGRPRLPLTDIDEAGLATLKAAMNGLDML